MQEYKLGQVESVKIHKKEVKEVEEIEVETTPIEKPKTTKKAKKDV